MQTAIYLDFENIYLGIPRIINQTEFAQKVLQSLLDSLNPTPTIYRAYADWENYQRAATNLSHMGFKPVYLLSHFGKNSADLEMSLDIHKMMLTNDEVDTFIVVTGDRDFLPITRRLLESGKKVIIASFSRCMSGDLKALADKGQYINLDQFLPPEVLEVVTDERQENLLLVMQRIVAAHKRFSDEGIWLVPFFKEWLNPAFPELNNEERKSLLSELELSGVITIEQMRDGSGKADTYSVIIPDTKNEMYIKAMEMVG